MKRSLTFLSIVPLIVLVVGCGQVQDAAQNAASSAVTQVASAAADQVKGQVCAVVEDGLVSVEDKKLLVGLVAGAETAGVPAEITDPMKQIAEAGEEVPAASVTELKKACTA
jgi:hypothetical protein